MKAIFFSLFAIFILNAVNGQTHTEPIKIAEISSQVISSDTIQYTFISNYYITDYKAPMLEGRLLDRYSEILDIQIIAETQTIIFKTFTVGSKVFLEKFITHFKYSGYEIH